jgi:hypothetical protein
MRRQDLVRWLYENRKMKELYSIELSGAVLLISEPQCIGIMCEDIEYFVEYECAVSLYSKYGVVTLWKGAQITHVTLCQRVG